MDSLEELEGWRGCRGNSRDLKDLLVNPKKWGKLVESLRRRLIIALSSLSLFNAAISHQTIQQPNSHGYWCVANPIGGKPDILGNGLCGLSGPYFITMTRDSYGYVLLMMDFIFSRF